ncbi:MAG: hypothetical protein ACKOD9_16780, partial [Rubrivivax sp.]
MALNSVVLVLCLGLAWYYRDPNRSHVKGAAFGYAVLVAQNVFAVKFNGLLPLLMFTGIILSAYLILPRRMARWVAGATCLTLLTAPLHTSGLSLDIWTRLVIVNAAMIGFSEVVAAAFTRGIDTFVHTVGALQRLS